MLKELAITASMPGCRGKLVGGDITMTLLCKNLLKMAEKLMRQSSLGIQITIKTCLSTEAIEYNEEIIRNRLAKPKPIKYNQ